MTSEETRLSETAAQKTEAQKADAPKTSVQKAGQRKYPGPFAWGLAVCLIASGIYLSCYGVFHTRAEQMMQELYDYCPLPQQYTTDWLMESTYVLYRDLRQKSTAEPISYRELYVHAREGCEWVSDQEAEQRYLLEEEDVPEFPHDNRVNENPPADSGRVYAYLELLDQYFENLEELFPNLNTTFGYRCEDVVTGESVGNLTEDQMQPEDQYFYLSFLFDAYGNCTVEQAFCGDQTTDMRKLASQAARQIRLENNSLYLEMDEAASVSMGTYLTLGAPANCRVVYSMSNAEWERMRNANRILIREREYSVRQYGEYAGYYLSGADAVLFLLGILVAVGGLYLPMSGGHREKTQRDLFLRLSCAPEFLGVLILAQMSFGTVLAVRMLGGFMSGTGVAALSKYVKFGGKNLIRAELYIANLVVLLALFGVFWYIGIRLREIRSLGIRGYIKKRSVIYQIFPFVKSKTAELYDSLVHFDVTRKANRMILKLVLINGVILFVISNLWMGGLAVALIYSVFLYIVLRRFISDLQGKYSVLLKAFNEIAQGNPNVQIKEDLGVFEPFKPQMHRIQQGFRSAVNEEVKSQRMRAELITNVSHDLKTPLTAIITYIDLLKEEQITEEQRREYLDTLERKSLRLKALIEDLFEISKADSQNMSLNLMEVDLMNLVKQVAFEMGDKFAEQNLDLRMDFPEGKVVLSLDSQRTYRVYENLFGNIAKYAMPGTRVYVSGKVQEDQVIVVLKNITAQEIAVNPQELTERFVRGDSSRNTEGSGLGLAIAKSFTQLQGGSLDIDVDGDLFKVTTVWSLNGNM